jgi:hypothetical protein
MRRADQFVAEVVKRLAGKVVWGVESSPADSALCRIITSDGKSFRIHATELGSWVEDDASVEGDYPSIAALSLAVGGHRERKSREAGLNELPPATAVLMNGTIHVDAGDGTLFSIKQTARDEWDRKVLSHPDVLKFIARVAMSSDMWMTWFDVGRRAEGYDAWIDGDRAIIPLELCRSFE